MRKILITKANGVLEPFDVDKLIQSLARSGASLEQAEAVASKVVKKIQPGDTTGHIYHEAFRILKKVEDALAARYSLRHALADLGPSGFPFELFISRIFDHLGYQSQVGLHIKGKCIVHEIDLLANNDKELIMGEVKFHNNSEIKNDSKTILYVHARFMDLQRSNFDGHNPNNLETQCWLITNTKFTQTTIDYSDCYGINLLGWNYPYDENSLQTIVESNHLEPITILTSLSSDQKKLLLHNKIVLCKYLQENSNELLNLGFSNSHIKQILNEIIKVRQYSPYPVK